jgi:hypothetical protein
VRGGGELGRKRKKRKIVRETEKVRKKKKEIVRMRQISRRRYNE